MSEELQKNKMGFQDEKKKRGRPDQIEQSNTKQRSKESSSRNLFSKEFRR